LFLSIPKTTINTIYASLVGKSSDDVPDYEEETYQEEMAIMYSDYSADLSSSEKGMPILKNLLLRYVIALTVIFVLVTIMFCVGYFFVVTNQTSGNNIHVSSTFK
jgi:hypothetical protein